MYDILIPMKEQLLFAYKKGANIPSTLLRDIEIYENFISIDNLGVMDKYYFLSEKYGISESSVRLSVKYMSKNI